VWRSHTPRPLEFGGPSLPLTAPQTPATQRGEATLRALCRGARAAGVGGRSCGGGVAHRGRGARMAGAGRGNGGGGARLGRFL